MPGLARLTLSPEGLAFDPNTGDTFVTNRSGLLIVRALQEGQTTEQVIETLAARYEVSLEEAARDVADFQSRMHSLGLS